VSTQATTANLVAGQQVRLLAVYHSRPFINPSSIDVKNRQQVETLPRGTLLTVKSVRIGDRKNLAKRLDGPTVILECHGKRWCIPTRLLEVVAVVSESPQATQKESARDTEGDRVG
jgi:hypothetical protein